MRKFLSTTAGKTFKEAINGMNNSNRDWNILSVAKVELNDLKPILQSRCQFNYYIFQDSIVRSYTPYQLSVRNVSITPIFFQASIEKLETSMDYIPDDITLNIYDRCKPINDRIMKLAMYFSKHNPSNIEIIAVPISLYAKEGTQTTECFDNCGQFHGYLLETAKTHEFCLPFGGHTLVIRKNK